MGTDFVKAAETKVAVEKTQEDLRTLVRRYGARGFGIRENWQTKRLEVELLLPNSPDSAGLDAAAFVPLRIPVDIDAVERRLRERIERKHISTTAKREQLHLQAQRTAWRIVYDLVDALLASVVLGGRTVAEAFQGDIVVQNERGEPERMAELLARTGGALPGGARMLVTSGPSLTDR